MGNGCSQSGRSTTKGVMNGRIRAARIPPGRLLTFSRLLVTYSDNFRNARHLVSIAGSKPSAFQADSFQQVSPLPFVGRAPGPTADALVGFHEVCRFPKSRTRGSGADQGIRPSVPGMGRILLDERSQPEPMTVTVANRKA